MDGAISAPSPIHYHIRWSGKPLDWEPFATVEAAQVAAAQMVRREESYTIEKFDADCLRCKHAFSWKLATSDD
ncbi:MAG TPA: hypothetical protein VMH20_07670 [Verrucomicrobiae bacterium]|nr:hypothetical protein [Verrucomicrobiae bacterium]